MSFKLISKTVWILSLVSFFTDVASEMLYPVMPIYLQSIGFSIVLIGVLEGVAEAVAGLSKGYFGKRSDLLGKRVPFVQVGYALSAISKPMMAMFVYPLWIFLARTIDRFGKGVRTGARDAILSDEANVHNKGTVFGFHRAMDTLGAVMGPSLALLYLHFYRGQYKNLFLIAFIPGLMALLASFLLKERLIPVPHSRQIEEQKTPILAFLHYWREAPKAYRQVVAGLLLFTLFNSSDVFLLLKVKQAGLSDTAVIGVYIFYNLVYALFALPAGILADRLGLKRVLIAGLCLFALVYAGMAVNSSWYGFLALFFVYGLYAAATEGISKAWLSNMVQQKDMGTALGTFAAFQSIATMLASSLAGLIWFYLGPTTAFIFTAVVTLVVAAYFVWLSKTID